MSRKPETIGRQLVPLFARNLAGFAANADRRIGEKSHLAHQRFPLYITAAHAPQYCHPAPGVIDALDACCR